MNAFWFTCPHCRASLRANGATIAWFLAALAAINIWLVVVIALGYRLGMPVTSGLLYFVGLLPLAYFAALIAYNVGAGYNVAQE
jgi:hypothetical protein